jgi:hypothetical protein
MKNIHDHLIAWKPPLRDIGHITQCLGNPDQPTYSISIGHNEYKITPALFKPLTNFSWRNIKEMTIERLEQ